MVFVAVVVVLVFATSVVFCDHYSNVVCNLSIFFFYLRI